MTVSKIGAKEFQRRVKAKLQQIDGNIKEEDLYFSQTATSYSMDYKPKYPIRDNADFMVYQDWEGHVIVYGNLYAGAPVSRRFTNINDFEENL